MEKYNKVQEESKKTKKGRMRNTTLEGSPYEAYEIIGLPFPRREKRELQGGINTQSKNNNKDSNKNSDLFSSKEIIIGFIFRTFIMVFLFLYGIKIVTLKNNVTETFNMWWFVRLIGVALVFASLYLLYNIFSKRVNNKSYMKWCGRFVLLSVLLFFDILGGGVALQESINTIKIVLF